MPLCAAGKSSPLCNEISALPIESIDYIDILNLPAAGLTA
jgi:hypothetical protein